MKVEKIFKLLALVFVILTFMGAGYVLYNKGQVNAGFAVVPSVFCLVLLQLSVRKKQK